VQLPKQKFLLPMNPNPIERPTSLELSGAELLAEMPRLQGQGATVFCMAATSDIFQPVLRLYSFVSFDDMEKIIGLGLSRTIWNLSSCGYAIKTRYG
jgi:hypothetical protein